MKGLRRTVASPTLARVALGLIYFHFGCLKWFPDLSPAEMLSTQTALRLDLGLEAATILRILAAWECLVGALLLLGVLRRTAAILLLLHLAGTFMPLVVLPELAFRLAPFVPTMEGQYVLKNLVFVAVGLQLFFGSNAAASARDAGQTGERR